MSPLAQDQLMHGLPSMDSFNMKQRLPAIAESITNGIDHKKRFRLEAGQFRLTIQLLSRPDTEQQTAIFRR